MTAFTDIVCDNMKVSRISLDGDTLNCGKCSFTEQ